MIVHWIVDGVSGSEATGYHSSLATNRYRAILPAQGLRTLGHEVRLIDMASWQPRNYKTDAKPDAIVIGKLLGGPRFESMKGHVAAGIRLAQSLGIKVIADINDDHFAHPVLGTHYKTLVSSADAVTAGSDAMAQVIRRHSTRPVFVVGDPAAAAPAHPHVYHCPSGWRRSVVWVLSMLGYSPPRLRLIWYGHPSNWPSMEAWIPRLVALAKQQPWLLTIVSNPGAGIESFVSGFNAAHPAKALLEFQPWSEQGLWPLVQDAHLVLIPADLSDRKKTVKSANRVLDALQSGRFVIASPVPAYCDLGDFIWLGDDPVAGIRWALNHPHLAFDKIRQGQAHVQAHYSIEAIASRWAEVFGEVTARTPVAEARPALTTLAKDTIVRLNLGCGDKILPGYLNVDVMPARAGRSPDLVCDLRRLALADSIADEVLAVHVVEHFWRWEVEDVLREWLRVLAPGGQLIIECPNLLSACEALLDNPVQAAEQDTRGRMTRVFYGDLAWRDPLMTRRWAYTPDSLIRLLENLGYVNVRQEPAQFKMREPMDMRVVGEKPAGAPMPRPLAPAEAACPPVLPARDPSVKPTHIWDSYSVWFYEAKVWKDMRWHGVRTLKMPEDMWNYQEIIFERGIEHVIETGTRHGGSALFFAEALAARGARGPVISIDIDDEARQVPCHPGIQFLIGNSASPEMVEQALSMLPQDRGPVFLILDSDHTARHVYAELEVWVPVLRHGDYLVVEDTNVNGHPVRPEHGPGPWEAVMDFLRDYPGLLVPDPIRERKFGVTAAPNGYYVRR